MARNKNPGNFANDKAKASRAGKKGAEARNRNRRRATMSDENEDILSAM